MKHVVNNILKQRGYDINFESYDLEDELAEVFNPIFYKQLTSHIAIMSAGFKPLNRYMDYAVEAIEYLSAVANNEIEVSNMVQLLKKLDVSDPLSYLVGEGLEKVIYDLEDMYNQTLQMIENEAPYLYVKDRYPFTNQMKKFCHIYIAQSLKPVAHAMSEHQLQLKKTCDAYSFYLSEKKNYQSSRIIAKVAGSLLGGVLGSLSITAIFAGMNSVNERRFNHELSITHHTWYAIQSKDLHQSAIGNYCPRVYHLYLSLIGGLLNKVSRDLNAVGLKMKNYYPNRFKIELDLQDDVKEEYIEYLERLLTSENNVDEVLNCIRTFTLKSYLKYILDSDGYLYIERLYAHYLYLQAKSILKNDEIQTLPDDIQPIYWYKELQDERGFSFLEDEKYKKIFNVLIEAFENDPNKMTALYASIVNLNKLYTRTDQPTEKKVFIEGPLTYMYFAAILIVKEEIPSEWAETYLDSGVISLIKELKEGEGLKSSLYKKAELWMSAELSKKKENLFIRIKNTFVPRNILNEAIQSKNYPAVLNLIENGNKIDSIEITDELASLQYRSMLKILSTSFKNIDLIINQDIVIDIIEKDDFQAMSLLLEIGLNPFLPINDSYLLAEVIVTGSIDMVYEVCYHCQLNIERYKNILSNWDIQSPSPYYALHIMGLGFVVEDFPELVRYIPADVKKTELTTVLSWKNEGVVCEMLMNGYDPQFIGENDIENPFLWALLSGSSYSVLNAINNQYPEILRAKLNDKTVLRHIYELGHVDMANHFHEVFQIHDIGTVYVEEIEKAVYELNKNFLILLKNEISNLEDILQELRLEANANGEWPIVQLIDNVLSA